MNPPEDPLDDLLALWQMEDSTPREFQRRVWHRIAADQDHLPWHAHLLAWFLQPKQFLSSFATSIALGVIAGLIASAWHEKQAHDAYLAAINPLNGHHQHQFTSR